MRPKDTGDPEMGGWRPLRPGEIPEPIRRPDYRTPDPFGYEDMGGTGAKGPAGARRRRDRAGNAEDERNDALTRRYRKLAKDNDWWSCRDIAHELLTKRLRSDERGEALYALGFAQEMLGNLVQAKQCYHDALRTSPDHAKALRRLGRIGTSKSRS